MKTAIRILWLMGLTVLAACANLNPTASPASPDGKGLAETRTANTPGATPPPVPTRTPTTIVAPASGSRYYHVSPEGRDINPGTQEAPFASIGKAAGQARAGDVVVIHAGVYFEDVKPARSGEADRYITYQGAGDGEVVIDAENGKRAACIEIEGKSYLQFIGLTVRGANSYETWPRAGISISDGASHIILDDIAAYDNYVGIMAHGRGEPVSFVTVRNSRTFDPARNVGNVHYGIFFYKKVYDSSILNNHVAYTLPEEQSYGIEISTDYPGSQADGARRISVIGNEAAYNESQGIHTWNAVGVLIQGNHLHDNGATGIQIEDGSENIVVENNLSENNAQKYEYEAGAWMDDTKNALVRNNIFRSNKIGLNVTNSERVIVHDNFIYLNNRGAENLYNAAGLIVGGSDSRIAVTHNTFYKNGADGMERGAANFSFSRQTCADIVFKNNIVSQTAGVVDVSLDACPGFVSDFNDFYNARPLAFQWDQAWMDWTAYRETSRQDAHSLTANPLFVNPSVFDFTLQLTSPLIGKGTALARTVGAGTGRSVVVTDAGYFSDGFGVGAGDLVRVGASEARIVSVDYAANVIVVDRDLRWDNDDAVSFPFSGAAPNIGAGLIP